MGIASRLNKILKQSSEFKSWFLVFRCFPRIVVILGLFLLFWIILKVVQFSWNGRDFMQVLCDIRGRFANVRDGFWLKTSVVEICNSKTLQICRNRRSSWLKKNGFLFSKLNLAAFFKWTVDLDSDVKMEGKDEKENDYEDGEFEEKDEKKNDNDQDGELDEKENDYEDGEFDEKDEKENDYEDGEFDENDYEDDVFDVDKLRELVKIQRKHKKEALEELEKERMAAASAAEEAMAMILRLQREKSAIDIQVNQFRRMAEAAEQKLQYNQEVIDRLKRIIVEIYELEGSLSNVEFIVRDEDEDDDDNDDDHDDAQMNNIDLNEI